MKASHPHKIDFKSLKAKVGVTDVAQALGYSIDRKAGVGRFVEMVKIDGSVKSDTIIIKMTPDKASQTFFRRDGSKGDAISLIREHLSSFNNESNLNEWVRIGKALSSLANQPAQDMPEANYLAQKAPTEFDPTRYAVRDFDESRGLPKLLSDRKLSEDTFHAFIPYIKMVYDQENKSYKGYNIGFPYISPADNSLQGYEMRGIGGFKSKAAGTNSSSAVWIADFSGGLPLAVENVYFFESAYDAMAFYQHNHHKINLESSVLVSVGGQMSNGQIESVIAHYPNAKAIDCYDNDMPGIVFGMRTALIAAGIPANVSKTPSGISIAVKDSIHVIPEDKASIKALSELFDLKNKAGEWKAPEGFKDWNDVVMGKQSQFTSVTNKFQRDEALAQRRSQMKL